MAETLCKLSLSEAVGMLRRREISALDLTESCISRIEALQAILNAFITCDHDAARAEAKRLDAEAARGQWRSALHGIPLAHKDMFDRPGRRVTHGSRLHAGRIATETATVLEKLDVAGAVDLGGLNMSEFACNPFGLNTLVGPAVNPWNPARIAGGSSSGSAAAVAAGLVFGSLGSDTGGSVRLPGAFCGLVALLPTRGCISRFGAMKLSPSLDAVGPLGRRVRDCALIFDHVAGPDPRDSSTIGGLSPVVNVLDRPAGGIAVGLPAARFIQKFTPAARAGIEAGIDALRRSGARLLDASMPDFNGLNAMAAIVMLPEMAAVHAHNLKRYAADYTPWVHDRLSSGFDIAAADYARALAIRGKVTQAFIEDQLADVDALLLPIATESPPRLDEILDEFTGLRTPRPDLGHYTRWTNYLGLPALTVPCGLDGDRLPIAVQLVGRPFSEPRLFQIGQEIERNTTPLEIPVL